MELTKEKKEELRKRNGAIITAKEYAKYAGRTHAAITKRLRTKPELDGIGNVSKLGRVFMLTINVK